MKNLNFLKKVLYSFDSFSINFPGTTSYPPLWMWNKFRDQIVYSFDSGPCQITVRTSVCRPFPSWSRLLITERWKGDMKWSEGGTQIYHKYFSKNLYNTTTIRLLVTCKRDDFSHERRVTTQECRTVLMTFCMIFKYDLT